MMSMGPVSNSSGFHTQMANQSGIGAHILQNDGQPQIFSQLQHTSNFGDGSSGAPNIVSAEYDANQRRTGFQDPSSQNVHNSQMSMTQKEGGGKSSAQQEGSPGKNIMNYHFQQQRPNSEQINGMTAFGKRSMVDKLIDQSYRMSKSRHINDSQNLPSNRKHGKTQTSKMF